MAEETSEPEIDLLPDAIADAFWLVAHGYFAPSAERLRIDITPPPPPPTPPPVLPPPTPGITKPPPPTTPPVSAPPTVPEVAPEPGQITLPTGHEQMKPGGEEFAGLPLRIPAGRALPGALELARALRPLMRRVPARTQLVLDEDETVRRVAEEGLWLPAMNPAPTRWLEVAVVVDANPSMRVWRETTRELRLLLERVGAFRDVRLWSLKSTPAKPGTPATMTLHAPGRKAVRAPAELLDPAGRRIILIVTDTMGEVWRDGTARRFMDGWCRRSCVALLHLLPQPLWRRTALKPARQIRVTTAEAGAPNLRLHALPLRPQALLWEAPDGVPIPVLPLEPAFVNAWAQLLAGSSRVRPLAVVFAPGDTPPETHRQGKTLSAVERVESFRNSNAGSPFVLQLASLFAAAPLRLPIMRLVQQALLPQSRQVHFAEVFLGGLMRRVSPAQEDEDPDEVAYEFYDGVRELLRNSSPIGDSIEVVKTVSRYIEGRFGSAFDFEAMLADPDTAQPLASGGVPEIFATISAEVLRGLGGAHARAADRLLKRTIPTALPSPLGNARRTLLNVLVQRLAIPLSNPLVDARRSLLDVLVRRCASPPYAEVLPPAEIPSPDRPFEGTTILWVDDNPSNNTDYAEQLKREGATVTEAESTAEALELLGRGFDAIISDLGRGDQEFAGFDLLKEVRGRGLTIPFAIFAGQRARHYRAQALELGATVSTSSFSEMRTALFQSLKRQESATPDSAQRRTERDPTERTNADVQTDEKSRTVKKLIICADGNWGQEVAADGEPTNVEKLKRALLPRDNEGVVQVVHYVRNAGTNLSEAIRGGALGRGIFQSVRDSYGALIDNYEPGTQLYFFGFSRGAYTVRCLASLVCKSGILRRGHEAHMDEAIALYRDSSPEAMPDAPRCTRFRAEHSHDAEIEMIGVWETVGALGLPGVESGFRLLKGLDWQFQDVTLNRRIRHAYHALAIHERRTEFLPTVWEQPVDAPVGQVLEQVWFSGAHSDVGGGYPEAGLADIALEWMVENARKWGLAFQLASLPGFAPDPLAVRHDSFGGLAKTLSFLKGNPRGSVRTFNPSRETNQSFHPSVLFRFKHLPSDQWPPSFLEELRRH